MTVFSSLIRQNRQRTAKRHPACGGSRFAKRLFGLRQEERKKPARCIPLLVLPFLMLTACSVHVPTTDFRELARASIRLGVDIGPKDNWQLYIESAQWIGTPYRGGGNSKRGIDCSGLTAAVYQKVYHKELGRSADDQRTRDCRRIKKSSLHEGDLVFFHNGRKKRVASHVGIYLKDGKFIHASTTRGVIVSSLKEEYYQKHWLSAGRLQ